MYISKEALWPFCCHPSIWFIYNRQSWLASWKIMSFSDLLGLKSEKGLSVYSKEALRPFSLSPIVICSLSNQKCQFKFRFEKKNYIPHKIFWIKDKWYAGQFYQDIIDLCWHVYMINCTYIRFLCNLLLCCAVTSFSFHKI